MLHHHHHQDGRLRPWVNPDSPGAGTGPTTSVYASGPRATRSTRPTPSRGPRWGNAGDASAGLPEEPEYHFAEIALPFVCFVWGQHLLVPLNLSHRCLIANGSEHQW